VAAQKEPMELVIGGDMEQAQAYTFSTGLSYYSGRKNIINYFYSCNLC
jgi:hypothetical protein